MNMIEICDSNQISEDEITKITIDAIQSIAVTRHKGEIFVFPDTCPHADESLSEGWVEDGRIICAVHFAEFDFGTGNVHNSPAGCPNLTFFKCEDRGGKIYAILTKDKSDV